MKRTPVIILSVVAAVMIIAIVVLSIIYNTSHTTSTATRSNADYIAAITKSLPGLLDNNSQPIFTVVSVTKLADNWYKVVVKSNQNSDTLRALIFDSTIITDTVSLIIGPSISFDKSEIPTSATLPDQVYQEFIK